MSVSARGMAESCDGGVWRERRPGGMAEHMVVCETCTGAYDSVRVQVGCEVSEGHVHTYACGSCCCIYVVGYL